MQTGAVHAELLGQPWRRWRQAIPTLHCARLTSATWRGVQRHTASAREGVQSRRRSRRHCYRHRHREGQKLRRTGEEWRLIERLADRYGFPDHVFHIPSGRVITVRSRRRSNFDRANFFHRLLRANVLFSDEEHNALNKLEGVIQQ
jgi:hypothetical protein